jgi:hypothetical protein
MKNTIENFQLLFLFFSFLPPKKDCSHILFHWHSRRKFSHQRFFVISTGKWIQWWTKKKIRGKRKILNRFDLTKSLRVSNARESNFYFFYGTAKNTTTLYNNGWEVEKNSNIKQEKYFSTAILQFGL